MIQQVEHTSTGTGAADIALALEIAGALHASAAVSRAPEVAAARPGGPRRAGAARGRRPAVRG